MKVVFCSNFMNHHQLPFCLQLLQREDVEFTFVATEAIPEERLSLGYADLNKAYPWILCTYDSEAAAQKAERLVLDADAVIIGSAPSKLVNKRMRAGKAIFRYSERIFKGSSGFVDKTMRRIAYWRRGYTRKNLHLLCASAYSAADYAALRCFRGRAYKWGYFPEVKVHADIEAVMQKKRPGSILWVARLIPWKHPEQALLLAKRLKAEGIDFTLHLIGNGPMEMELRDLIVSYQIEDRVQLLGSMSPEEVRCHMEASELFLFTSDRGEGWGAVLNEAMNSACAVVASHAIGSVPFLLQDGVNGMIYRDGDLEDLYRKVKQLLSDHGRAAEMGRMAYRTMMEDWRAETAAQRFLQLAQAINHGSSTDIFPNGPCSKAALLADDWYEGSASV